MTGPFIYQGETSQNPVSVDFLIDKILDDIVAVTGGEPLLQVDFLMELCKKLKKLLKKVYLDTNATLPAQLKQVIKHVDTISLDFKIPTATGRPRLWDEHEKCLKIATQKEVFVKMVINENVIPDEIAKTCDIIAKIDSSIPLVIQPVYGHSIPRILDFQSKALARLENVRIIPQVHKYLGLP